MAYIRLADLKLKSHALVGEIRAYCAANADREKAKKYARYFSEGYDSWGLLDKNHDFWNSRQESWLSRYQDLGLKGFLVAGEELVKSGKYEEASIAIRFIQTFHDEMDASTIAALSRWFDGGIRNWAHVDVLCDLVLAPLLVQNRAGLKEFEPWRSAEHKFQRRASAVVLLGLVKKGNSPGKLLRHLVPLMADKEKVVKQGTAWVLREMAKRWPAQTEAFASRFRRRRSAAGRS